jgi:hypothetical protein
MRLVITYHIKLVQGKTLFRSQSHTLRNMQSYTNGQSTQTFNLVFCRFEPGRLYMPTYNSYEEAKEALREARILLKEARKEYGKTSPEAQRALTSCAAIQTIIDKVWPGRK